ncbi:hypothetical protein MOXK02_02460 [Moraxella sp. K02]
MKNNLLIKMGLSLLFSSMFIQGYAKTSKTIEQAAYETATRIVDGENADIPNQAEESKSLDDNTTENYVPSACVDGCPTIDTDANKEESIALIAKETPYESDYQKPAENNDKDAQLKLIKLYLAKYELERTSQHQQQLLYWLKKADKNGVLQATNLLGILYQFGGYGFPQDVDKAIAYYNKLVASNDSYHKAIAESALAGTYLWLSNYSNGKYKNDYEKARYWYKKAHEDGSVLLLDQALEQVDDLEREEKQANAQ